MTNSELEKEILSKRTWWVNDLKNFIVKNKGNAAWKEFRDAMNKYGDYPLQSMATSKLLSMFVDDIGEFTEDPIDFKTFETMLTEDERFHKKDFHSMISEIGDNVIERHFGADVLLQKDEILRDFKRVNLFLSEKIPGYSTFRYYDPKTRSVYYDSDYNCGTDQPTFIGIGYVSIGYFREVAV